MRCQPKVRDVPENEEAYPSTFRFFYQTLDQLPLRNDDDTKGYLVLIPLATPQSDHVHVAVQDSCPRRLRNTAAPVAISCFCPKRSLMVLEFFGIRRRLRRGQRSDSMHWLWSVKISYS